MDRDNKITDKLTEDCIETAIKLVCNGIKIEKQLVGEIYFSVPEHYSSDRLKEIEDEYQSNNILEVGKTIIADFMKVVVRVELNEESDEEVDEEILSFTVNQMRYHGKYRTGETWTQKEVERSFDEFISKLKEEKEYRSKSEYIEV